MTAQWPLPSLTDLIVDIYADGADKAEMLEMYALPYIRGFTTNPTLMRRAGITNYRAFALDVLQEIPDRPISFEVFSDDPAEMERQALEITSWGENVFVKIPVTTVEGVPCFPLIKSLASKGVKMNVTAITTLNQVSGVVANLDGEVPACVSVFAGRIADTGRDPLPLMEAALALIRMCPAAKLIWASPRELLNVVQAARMGCDIITVTSDLLKKLPILGKDLSAYSLETVRMFSEDARAAGFSL
jgi:transaldolase